MLLKRKEYARSGQDEKGRLLCGRLTELSLYKEADRILCYMSYPGEADTRPIIEKALSDGKTVAFPKVLPGGDMAFYACDPDELRLGAYGIMEPGASEDKLVADGLMIMPLVAFDEKRNRIGHGGGYYDRYLEKYHLKTVALAYEFQKTDMIPADPYDIKPDIIVTEDKIYI